MVVGVGVKGANEATVAATVTVQNISVTISAGTPVAYGTMANNTSKTTIDVGVTPTAKNNGNVTETFNIKGTNSTSWTLGAVAGSNVYVHKFCKKYEVSCTTPPTNYTALTTGYTALATGVAINAEKTLDLQITTPNPSTAYDAQQVDVIVQAVAP